MTPYRSAPSTSPLTTVGVDPAQRIARASRLTQLVAPCRNLAIKFLQNPRWGVMFTFGRFRLVSNTVVFLHRSHVPRPGPEVPSLFPALDVDAALRNIRREGVCCGMNLPPDVVAQIRTFAGSMECYWPGDRSVRFVYGQRGEVERRIGKPILLGRYFDVEDRCPAIHAISHDPLLRYLAARYLGAVPGQTETRLWWSFAADAAPSERLKADQGFHYDLHDYRSIAFFFHLTDVDDYGGPHVHVKGSHVHKPLRLLLADSRQASDDEIVAQYGAENVLTLCGRAGFGFATDPFGYHKGAPPLRDDRLMLRVRFTIHDDGSRVDKSDAAH